VTANSRTSEDGLTGFVLPWLRARLPDTWTVGLISYEQSTAAFGGRTDLVFDVRGPDGTSASVVVDAKGSFGPRDVDRLLGGLGRILRALATNTQILIVAPWLSRRTQELLRSERINYLDLAGNAYLRLDSPALFIATEGAVKDPNPAVRGKARVKGPKAGRLLRTLIDINPPYGVRELADALELNPGYVSRLLDSLDDEALIERSPRGQVEAVDIPRLFDRWAQTYDVFRDNSAMSYLAPAGASDALQRLRDFGETVAVTGSFAAVRKAPIAAPALLMAYSRNLASVANTLALIPADEGANVVLLRAFDPVVWQRTSNDEGITFVAPAQAAVDCLTGTGRMPAEGEALIGWMTGNEQSWRLPHLPVSAQGALA